MGAVKGKEFSVQGIGYGCFPVEISGRCLKESLTWHAKLAKVVKLASN